MVHIALSLDAFSLEEVEAFRASNSNALAFLHGVELRAGGLDALVISNDLTFRASGLDALVTFELGVGRAGDSDALVVDNLEAFTALFSLVAEAILEDEVGRAADSFADSVLSEHEMLRALNLSASVSDHTELLVAAAGNCEALAVLQFVTWRAGNSDAFTVDEAEVLLAASSDALVTVGSEADRALVDANFANEVLAGRAASSLASIVLQSEVFRALSLGALAVNKSGTSRAGFSDAFAVLQSEVLGTFDLSAGTVNESITVRAANSGASLVSGVELVVNRAASSFALAGRESVVLRAAVLDALSVLQSEVSRAANLDALSVLESTTGFAAGSDADAILEGVVRFARLVANTVEESKSSGASELDALVFLQAEVLVFRAELLGANVVLELVTASAFNLEALAVLELFAGLAGNGLALVTVELGSGGTFNSNTLAVSHGGSDSAVLLASTVGQGGASRAADSGAFTFNKLEVSFTLGFGLDGNTLAVNEVETFSAGDLLANTINLDGSSLAGVDGFGGRSRSDSGLGNADAVLESETFSAGLDDALAVNELEVLGTSDLNALAILELRVFVAGNLEAVAILEDISVAAARSDALVTRELEASIAFGSDALGSLEREALLAGFVALALDELEAIGAGNSDAFSTDELVELVARDGNAARADLLGTGSAGLDGANTVLHFVSFSAGELEALVVSEDRSFRALNDDSLDALAILEGESFTALAHNTGTVLELEAFLASDSLASLGLLVELEELRFTTADGEALVVNELLANRAANSVANVLLGGSIVLEGEAFSAANLVADSVVEGLAFRAGLNADTALKSVSGFAGEDDALSEVSVVLLVDRAVNLDAFAILELEASTAFNSDALAVLLNLADRAGNLEAVAVLKDVARLAAVHDTLAGLDIVLAVFAAAVADSVLTSGVTNGARSDSGRSTSGGGSSGGGSGGGSSGRSSFSTSGGSSGGGSTSSGRSSRSVNNEALVTIELLSSRAASSDALTLVHGVVLRAASSLANSVNLVEVLRAVLLATILGEGVTGLAANNNAFVSDELFVVLAVGSNARAILEDLTGGAGLVDAGTVLEGLVDRAADLDALVAGEDRASFAASSNALSVDVLEISRAGNSNANSIIGSLEVLFAESDALAVDKLVSGGAGLDDTDVVFNGHSSRAADSDALVLLIRPLVVVFSASNLVAFTVGLEDESGGTGGSDTLAISEGEVLVTSNGLASAVFESNRSLRAVLGANALSLDGCSGVTGRALLVDALNTIPDESLTLGADFGALVVDEVFARSAGLKLSA